MIPLWPRSNPGLSCVCGRKARVAYGRLYFFVEIEDAFTDDCIFECFVAEAIIQSLIAGKYIDLTDVKNGFQPDRYCNIVLNILQHTLYIKFYYLSLQFYEALAHFL